MLLTEQFFRLLLKSYFTALHRTYDVKGHTSLPPGPKIIAMNHTSGCDPFFLPFVIEERPHFLIQHDLFDIPMIGYLLKQTGQIPVHQETPKARDAKEQACALLREGKTIAIFPEGRIIGMHQRVPAKSGTVRMAIETGAPIIPLGLYAPSQILTPVKLNWQGSSRSGEWQFKGKSYMRFGAAWKPNGRLDIHTQTEELMNRIYSLVAEAERESQCVLHTLLNRILQ